MVGRDCRATESDCQRACGAAMRMGHRGHSAAPPIKVSCSAADKELPETCRSGCRHRRTRSHSRCWRWHRSRPSRRCVCLDEHLDLPGRMVRRGPLLLLPWVLHIDMNTIFSLKLHKVPAEAVRYCPRHWTRRERIFRVAGRLDRSRRSGRLWPSDDQRAARS